MHILKFQGAGRTPLNPTGEPCTPQALSQSPTALQRVATSFCGASVGPSEPQQGLCHKEGQVRLLLTAMTVMFVDSSYKALP